MPDKDKVSLDSMLPEVYSELHRLAAGYMRHERAGHTLQPTALVNEAYLRLARQHSLDFSNRGQLLGVAAQMMRRILRSHDERRGASKRGGEVTIVCLTQSKEPAAPTVLAFTDVDEALNRLAALDDRQSTVAELRIFGGMNSQEIGDFLRISVATAHRDWATARLWLMAELQPAIRTTRPA